MSEISLVAYAMVGIDNNLCRSGKKEMKSRYTPVIFGEGTMILVIEERIVPFTPLEGLEFEEGQVRTMIDKAYAKTFALSPFGEIRKFNNAFNIYPMYRLLTGKSSDEEGNRTFSKFKWYLNVQFGDIAMEKLFDEVGLPRGSNFGLYTRPRGKTVGFLAPKEKDELIKHKILLIMRYFRSLDEILYYSVDGVESVYTKFIPQRPWTRSKLIAASEEVKAELMEEIETILERVEKSETKASAKSKMEKIARKRISLSFIDKFISQADDYVFDDAPDEPLMKRVLYDALLGAKWKFDFPGFLTAQDIEEIFSDERLLRDGEYYFYLNETRPVSRLREACYS